MLSLLKQEQTLEVRNTKVNVVHSQSYYTAFLLGQQTLQERRCSPRPDRGDEAEKEGFKISSGNKKEGNAKTIIFIGRLHPVKEFST